MKSFFLARAFALALLFTSFAAFAQHLDIKLSEPIEFSRSDRWFARNIICESPKNLYVLIGDAPGAGWVSSFSESYIQVFDKQTMQPTVKVDVDRLKLSRAKILEMVCTSSGILVYSMEDGYNVEAVISVVTLDWEMNLQHDPKPVLVFDKMSHDFSIKLRPGSDDVAVLTQKYVEAGEPINVDYIILKNGTEEVKKGTFQYPLTQIKQNTSLLFNLFTDEKTSILDRIYHAPTGEFISIHLTRTAGEDRQGDWDILFASPETGAVFAMPLELEEDRWIQYPKMFLSGDDFFVTGFYRGSREKGSLLSKETRTIATTRTEGTFVHRYNLGSRKLINRAQVPFEEQFVHTVNSQNPAYKSLFGNQVRDPNLQDISALYEMNAAIFDEETNTARVYCEYVMNTASTHTDVNGSNTTTYLSTRGNLFYFEISLETGFMNWAESIRKYVVFQSGSPEVWDRTSMKVIPGEREDAILFYTDRLYNEHEPSDVRGAEIKMKDFEQRFVTARVDRRKGSYELVLPRLASRKVDDVNRVQLEKVYLSQYESTLYTINTGKRINWVFTCAACATWPCMIGLFAYMLMPQRRYFETYTVAQIRNE